MLNTKTKICFIGAGAMAEAIVAGMISKKIVTPPQIAITNKDDRFRLDQLVSEFGVVADGEQKKKYIEEADILILAMKPKDVNTALQEIRHLTNDKQLIISVVAGISTPYISSLLKHEAPVIRTMPNTSATIGLSATGICAGATATSKHLAIAKEIFDSIGIVSIVEEDKLDAITGLTGSGPAYIYYLVEAMQKGAIEVGLDPEEARHMILQTVIGSAHMLIETGFEPSYLREKVTSPNGTTQAGLDVLKSFQFEEAVIQCIKRATERSQELGKKQEITRMDISKMKNKKA